MKLSEVIKSEISYDLLDVNFLVFKICLNERNKDFLKNIDNEELGLYLKNRLMETYEVVNKYDHEEKWLITYESCGVKRYAQMFASSEDEAISKFIVYYAPKDEYNITAEKAGNFYGDH